MNWHSILNNVVYPGLITIFGVFLTALANVVRIYVKSKFKNLNHFKGDSVVQECILKEIDELSDEAHKALLDNKLDEKDFESFKNRIRTSAESKLKHLYGFYKSDLIGWIDDRIDNTLPKLISPKVKAFISRNL